MNHHIGFFYNSSHTTLNPSSSSLKSRLSQLLSAPRRGAAELHHELPRRTRHSGSRTTLKPRSVYRSPGVSPSREAEWMAVGLIHAPPRRTLYLLIEKLAHFHISHAFKIAHHYIYYYSSS